MAHRFKIGDVVALKAACVDTRGHRCPVAAAVSELLTQTCPGGTQYQYRLCGETNWVLDELLLPWDSPEVAACFEAAEAAAIRQEELRQEASDKRFDARVKAHEEAAKVAKATT